MWGQQANDVCSGGKTKSRVHTKSAGAKLYDCEHGKQRSKCMEGCGGGSICAHGIQSMSHSAGAAGDARQAMRGGLVFGARIVCYAMRCDAMHCARAGCDACAALRCTVRRLFVMQCAAMQCAARGLVAFARCRLRHAFDRGILRVVKGWGLRYGRRERADRRVKGLVAEGWV